MTADVWESSYEIDRPYQDVTHDVAVLSTDLDGDWGAMEVTYAFQMNLRKEYEHVRGDNPWPQYDFTLRTHSVDASYEQPSATMAFGELTGGFGIQGGFQENVYQGFSLIPNFRSFSGGLFVYERLSVDRFDFEMGARADGLMRATYIRDNDYDAHLRRGTLNTDACEEREQTARCPADYTAASFSVGTLFHAVPDHIDFKLDLSTATRFPNVDELYMLGYAPTFPVYANGFPDLDTETVYNASFTAGLRTLPVEAEASVYGQRVDDYIYFAPELNADGQPRFDVTIRGTWPTYSFRPIAADFYGADGSVDLGPQAPVGFQAVGAVVRAKNRNTGDELIGTPADHITLAAIGRAPPRGAIKKMEFRVQADLVAEQFRVNPDQDTAPPPEGYTLWGASIDTEIGHRRPIRLGIDAHNLFNLSYREYTSLLRYYGDQPGRDVRVRVGVDF